MQQKLLTTLLSLLILFGAYAQTEEQEQEDTLSAAPKFSKKHGLNSKSFYLRISPSVSGRKIKYTTDGSKPTLDSPTYSTRLNISKTTVVRAAEVVKDDSLSAITTASYLFPEDIVLQGNDANGKPITPEGYPEEWGSFAQIIGTAPGYYAMDSEIVNESKDKIIQGFKDLPIVSIVTDKENLFSHEEDEETGGIYIYTGAPVGNSVGRDWERPISLEFIGGENNLDISVDCAVKMHGGHSRLPEKTPKHAFRLMFKSKYGPKHLYYPIFGEEGVEKFEDLILRTYFGNSWEHWDESNRKKAQYTRDLWARSVQERLGQPNSKGQAVHLFLNGMYWGIYNLCERINKEHCAYHFGGKKKDYDIIKVEETEGEKVVAADGNLEAWEKMLSKVEQIKTYSNAIYYELQGLDTKGNPSEDLEPLLDMESFCDYMLINFYGGNTDWDHHNWYAIRNRENPEKGFQFICWDTELIFGSATENVTKKDNVGKPSHILNCLMNNVKFQKLFNHRAHVLLTEGGLLTEEGVREVWDSLYHNIEYAIYGESARWGDYRRDIHPYTAKGHRYRVDTYFQNERTRLTDTYFPNRTNTVISQLKELGWYLDYDTDALEDIVIDNQMARHIVYDIHGRKVGYTDEKDRLDQSLPQGIYIVKGKKIIKR